jgi:hypothetical protein
MRRARKSRLPLSIRIMRYVWSSLAVLLLSATQLHGQVINSPYRFIETRNNFTFFAGHISVDPGRNNQAPKSGTIYGGRYHIHFAGPISGELGLSISPTTRTIYDMPDDSETLQALATTNTTYAVGEVGLRLRFTGQRTWHGLAPYGSLTGGVVGDATSANQLEMDIPEDQFFRFGLGFASGVALGTDLFVGDRFSLRAEVRDYMWRLSYPSGLSAGKVRVTEWTHNFAPTLGGSYHF